MIISHKHEYVFVEVPRTGSTSISRELCEYYDGEPILYKHAHYNEFLEVCQRRERDYFVFGSIRNPLDQAVTEYLKFRNNHRNHYTNPKQLEENGGWITKRELKRFRFVQQNNAEFPEYFKNFFRFPYVTANQFQWSKEYFDYVIRYENLNEEFATVLRKLGIEPVRDLPRINATSDKRDFLSYYTPDIRLRAIRVFGSFMEYWGYPLPPAWGYQEVPRVKAALPRFLYHAGRASVRDLRLSRKHYRALQTKLTAANRALRWKM